MRQDLDGPGIPRPWGHAVRRTRRLRRLRGDRRGTGHQRRLAGFRPGRAGGGSETGHRLRPHRAERDRGIGGVRPRGPLHPDRVRHRFDRGQAGRDRHPGGALRRAAQPGHPADRAAPVIPLAQGEGRHRDRHRRARRQRPDPQRTRGIHLRLRDLPRPAGQRADLDPAVAGGEIPGLCPRRRRGPLPDR